MDPFFESRPLPFVALDFPSSSHDRGNDNMMIAVACVIVIALYVQHQQISQIQNYMQYPQSMVGKVHGMISRIDPQKTMKNVAAMITSVPYGNRSLILNAEHHPVTAKHGLSSSKVVSAKNVSALTADESERLQSEGLDLIKRSPNDLLVLYADWCPHCHNTMDVLSKHKKHTSHMIFIDSDAVPKLLTSDDALFRGVRYFPYTCTLDDKGNLSEITVDDWIRKREMMMEAASAKVSMSANSETQDESPFLMGRGDEGDENPNNGPFDDLF